MSLFERAVLYICRKGGKSLILFFILLLISTLMLTGLSIQSASETAAYHLRKLLGGSFSMMIDKSKSDHFQPSKDEQLGLKYIGKPITDKIVRQISSVQGIRDFNAIQVGNALLQGKDAKFLELIKTNSKYEDKELVLHTITGEANSKSEYSSYFQKGTFQLKEGAHLTKQDKNAAIISRELADLNHLKIGDEIRMALSESKGSDSVFLKIKGIFEIVEHQGSTAALPPPSLYQNRIFIDNFSGTALYAQRGSGYSRVDFFVDDPAEMANVIETAKEIKPIPWDYFSLSANDAEYQKAVNPLNRMNTLIKTMLLTVTIAGIAVLSLLLTLWMKSRIHETGILLSIGIQKSKIILQYMVEIMSIAIIAFSLSFFISGAIVNNVGDAMSDSTLTQKQDNRQTSNLDIHVTLSDAAMVYGLGTLVAVASVWISSISTLRLKPKEILTKMSE